LCAYYCRCSKRDDLPGLTGYLFLGGVILYAAYNFSIHLFGLHDYSLEHILFQGYKVSVFQAGVMSPYTAALVIITAVSVLLSAKKMSNNSKRVAVGLSILSAICCLIIIISYVAGSPVLYHVQSVPVALLTAICILLLNVALLIFRESFFAYSRISPDADLSNRITGVINWNTLVIALVLVIIIGSAGIYFLRATYHNYRDRAASDLEMVGEQKREQIETWYQTRLREAYRLSSNTMVNDFAARQTNDRLDCNLILIDWMTKWVVDFHYSRMTLLDLQGRVLINIPQQQLLSEARLDPNFHNAIKNNRITFTDLHFSFHPEDQERKESHMNLWVPVSVSSPANIKEVVGCWLIQFNPNLQLFPQVTNWTKYARTGETLIIRREGDSVLYLNNLRFKPNSALTYRITIKDNPDLPAANALRGKTGIMEGIDYRGHEVLSYICDIKGLPWMFIAKVDKSEIYDPLRRQIWIVWIIIVMSFFLMASGIGYWEKSRDEQWLKRKLALELEGKQYLERLNILYQHANDINLLLDKNLNIVDCNLAAENTYAYTEQELKSMNIIDLRASETRSGLEELIREEKDRKGLTIETLHIKKDGTIFPVESSIHSVQFGDETVYQTVIRDITERKKIEAMQQQINEELEQRVQERTAQLSASNLELETFSYTVSHDLRSPLRGIDGWSLALLDDYKDKLDAKAGKYLATIRSEAQRMDRIIDALLNFTKVTKSEMNIGTVNLSEIANRIIANFNVSEPNRKIEYVVQPDMIDRGDPILLDMVLINLIGNAIKFTRSKPSARIEFGKTNIEGNQTYYVKDNGAGFDMNYYDKLFKTFSRLHKSNEYPGTGIGLATVHRIITKHGGRIWAKSIPELYTIFYFTLKEN